MKLENIRFDFHGKSSPTEAGINPAAAL